MATFQIFQLPIQPVWAGCLSGQTRVQTVSDGYFVEAGAVNGVLDSNTLGSDRTKGLGCSSLSFSRAS